MIETSRLRLVPCELRHFEAIPSDQGQRKEQLGQMLGVTVCDNAFDFPGVASIETMRFLYRQLNADPEKLGWWTYLFVHAEDGVLIGQGGYKGRPDEAGMVEIGYAIAPAYRRRGLATEAAQGLIDHAFAHDNVKRINAHTLPERNASVKVLERVGMKFVRTANDSDVGEVWRWSLQEAAYHSSYAKGQRRRIVEQPPPSDNAASGLRRFEASQGPRIIGPGDGKAVDLGSLGVRFIVWSEESGGGFSLVEHPIPPRTLAAPLHRHAHEDEYSYVLEGRLGAQLGDEIVYAEEGDLVFKPRDQWHTFWNAGDGLCRILEIISPGGFEHLFEEAAEGSRTPVDERTPALDARYGLEIDHESVERLCEEHGLVIPDE